jgi:hypothetical protein
MEPWNVEGGEYFCFWPPQQQQPLWAVNMATRQPTISTE